MSKRRTLRKAIEVIQLLDRLQDRVSPQDAQRIRQLAEALDGDGRVTEVLPLLYRGPAKPMPLPACASSVPGCARWPKKWAWTSSWWYRRTAGRAPNAGRNSRVRI